MHFLVYVALFLLAVPVIGVGLLLWALHHPRVLPGPSTEEYEALLECVEPEAALELAEFPPRP